MLNQLINLTSVFITPFVECFSAVFKNITHALHKQIHPYKAGRKFIWVKKVPPKRNASFMKVRSLRGGRIYFHVNRF